MKIHHNLCHAVVQALHQIFGESNSYADKVIEATLRSDARFGARDRAFIAENIYGIVRHVRLLQEIYGRTPTGLADWWHILEIRLLLEHDDDLPAFAEFQGLDRNTVRDQKNRCCQHRAIRESVPDWLDTLGEQALGPAWDDILRASNQTAPVALRVNTLSMSLHSAKAGLEREQLFCTPFGEWGLLLNKRANIFRSRVFQSGGVEVQDVSSQQVAPFLQVKPGMCVVDACAGGGGKTLHLAALLQNKGRLIALDTEAWKLENLKKRARRAGAHCIETRPITSAKVIKRLHQTADRLLLDVPCSGLGVLRRNPDTKWKLQPEQLERLLITQQDILQRYAAMLKPDGIMVYATCSVLPQENEQQVRLFLKNNPGKFILLEEKHILPGENMGDGFYMARLSRCQ
jgi:16S rRNA (cytosine967-C5)-methyltransferase